MADAEYGAAFAAQVAAAAARAREAAAREPRAETVAYVAAEGAFRVTLRNGWTVSFPPAAVEGLAGAPAEALADVEVDPGGEGLHWETLDVDVSLPGLLFHALGLRHWAAKFLASHTSEAKAAAARENGKKGGRPRKRRPGEYETTPGTGVVMVHDAPSDREDENEPAGPEADRPASSFSGEYPTRGKRGGREKKSKTEKKPKG